MLNFQINNLDEIVTKASTYGAILDGDKIETDDKKVFICMIKQHYVS